MRHIISLALIAGVFALLARHEIFSWPYCYDEADYISATRMGWEANYTDRPSLPIGQFVRTGLSHGTDPSTRATLSREARAESDVTFYRHWHGPLYFYWLLSLRPQHLDERTMRALSYVFPVATTLLIYTGCVALFPVIASAPILSSALYLWSYPTVFSNEIAPHQLYVFFVIASLMLVMRSRQTGEARYWYLAVVSAAAAFCTLEIACTLVFVLLLETFHDRRRLGQSALLFCATVLALWPAAWLRLSILKAYLFMAYLALIRKSPWGEVSFLETWRLRFTQSPIEWLMLAAAAVLFFIACDNATRLVLKPLALYGFLTLLVLLRVNTETPRYMLPFLPAFLLSAGVVLASTMRAWKPRWRLAATVGICALLLANTYAQIHAHPILPSQRLPEVLTTVRAASLDGKRLLVPRNDLPMIHSYFPSISLSGYVDQQEKSQQLKCSTFDAMLDPGYPVNLQRLSPTSDHSFSQP